MSVYIACPVRCIYTAIVTWTCGCRVRHEKPYGQKFCSYCGGELRRVVTQLPESS